MVWIEHAMLLGAGLVAGVLAASVAMIPSWSDGRATSVSASALLVGALAISGAFWVWAAGRLALRGGLLERLRAD